MNNQDETEEDNNESWSPCECQSSENLIENQSDDKIKSSHESLIEKLTKSIETTPKLCPLRLRRSRSSSSDSKHEDPVTQKITKRGPCPYIEPKREDGNSDEDCEENKCPFASSLKSVQEDSECRKVKAKKTKSKSHNCSPKSPKSPRSVGSKCISSKISKNSCRSPKICPSAPLVQSRSMKGLSQDFIKSTCPSFIQSSFNKSGQNECSQNSPCCTGSSFRQIDENECHSEDCSQSLHEEYSSKPDCSSKKNIFTPSKSKSSCRTSKKSISDRSRDFKDNDSCKCQKHLCLISVNENYFEKQKTYVKEMMANISRASSCHVPDYPMEGPCQRYVTTIPNDYLIIRGPFDTVRCTYLQVQNMTKETIAFRMLAIIPKRYCVQPQNGIIKPKKMDQLKIMFAPLKNADPRDYPVPHYFLLQSAPTSQKERCLNLDSQYWKRQDPDIIHNYVFGIYFIPDAQKEFDTIIFAEQELMERERRCRRINRLLRLLLLVVLVTAAVVLK